ncbi:MAG: type IV pilin protein [Gammaproteobacteria bacterium]
MNRQIAGFTLIELMIVVTLLAILAAFAVPSYRDYVYKGRRADAKAALTTLSLAEEKWRANNPSYTGTIADIGSTTSSDGYYTLSILSANDTTYQLQAAPTGKQADDKCGSFRIDQDGTKTLSGNASGYDVATCW